MVWIVWSVRRYGFGFSFRTTSSSSPRLIRVQEKERKGFRQAPRTLVPSACNARWFPWRRRLAIFEPANSFLTSAFEFVSSFKLNRVFFTREKDFHAFSVPPSFGYSFDQLCQHLNLDYSETEAKLYVDWRLKGFFTLAIVRSSIIYFLQTIDFHYPRYSIPRLNYSTLFFVRWFIPIKISTNSRTRRHLSLTKKRKPNSTRLPNPWNMEENHLSYIIG